MPFDSVNYESDRTRVLRQILDHLSDRRHWIKYTNKGWGGRVCTVGAVNMFADYWEHRDLNIEIVDLLFEASGEKRGHYLLTNRIVVKNHNDRIDHLALVLWLKRTLDMSIIRDAKVTAKIPA